MRAQDCIDLVSRVKPYVLEDTYLEKVQHIAMEVQVKFGCGFKEILQAHSVSKLSKAVLKWVLANQIVAPEAGTSLALNYLEHKCKKS